MVIYGLSIDMVMYGSYIIIYGSYMIIYGTYMIIYGPYIVSYVRMFSEIEGGRSKGRSHSGKQGPTTNK